MPGVHFAEAKGHVISCRGDLHHCSTRTEIGSASFARYVLTQWLVIYWFLHLIYLNITIFIIIIIIIIHFSNIFK